MNDKGFSVLIAIVFLVWLVMIGLLIWAIINIVPALVHFLTK